MGERRPFSVALVQMPFAPLKQAPLALLQLQAVLERELGPRVSTRIVYPSHDFGLDFGLRLYHQIAYVDSSLHSGEMSGLGDWLFRGLAFPELPDNTRAYRTRYFSSLESRAFLDFDEVLAARARASTLLDRIIERYALADADLVGFTSMFAQHVACLAMARRLKAGTKAPVVVIGGANCEAPMGQALVDHVPWLDAVFSGPALESFPAYVRGCLDGTRPPVTAVRGVLTTRRIADASPAAAPRATPVTHDQLGAEREINRPLRLDYAGFLDTFERAFDGTLEPVLTFETSRGCWWGAKAHCPFCGLNGSTMAFRAMTPPNALAVFEELFAHAARSRVFECVDNIMPADYPTSVFPHLAAPPRVSIYYEVKADLTADDLASMTRAGVRIIQPGIEALSTPSLKVLKKGTHAFGNVLLLKNCLTYGVAPLWNLLIGIPLEEQPRAVYAKYAADIPKLRHLPPPWAVFMVRIDRFSPYFVRPEQYGLKLRPKAFYRFVYPFGEGVLADLAYYFDDEQAGGAEYAAAAAEWHPALHALVKDWAAAWQLKDPTQRPALFVESGPCGHRLHDSRQGTAIDDRIDDAIFETLQLLARPTRAADLLQRLDAAGHARPQAIVEELRDRQLLFEEGERLLSLVHLGPRPVASQAGGGI